MKKLTFLFLFFWIIPAYGATVAVDVSVDTTWTTSQSPYLLQGFIIVDENATLSIDPGVIVKASPGAFILVRGKMIAGNNVGSPVIFTSIKDDESGGDTNNDGAGSEPKSKDWDGILFELGSEGVLHNAVIQFSGGNLAGVINDGGVVSFSGSTFKDNFNRAIWHKKGETTIENTYIEGDVFGVYVESGALSMVNSILKDIVEHGISAFYTGNIHIEKVNFQNVKIPAAIAASVDFSSQESKVEGGTMNGFLRFGSTIGNHVWSGGDLPYIIHLLEIAPSTTLSLVDGLILKFDQNEMIVSRGEFLSLGSEEKPIIITSLRDDAFGGDTNMDGSSTVPQKGDWNLIQFDQGSENQFNHTKIFYGGTNIFTPDPRSAIVQYGGNFLGNFVSVSSSFHSAFTVKGGIFNFSNSEIHTNDKGVVVDGGDVSISQSRILNNNGVGIENVSQNFVEAKNNWWGSETGPFHPDFNADGEGEGVYGNVNFKPWLLKDLGSTPVEECCSNVAFIPGLGGSRLYRNGIFGTDRIWEPNGINDTDQLMMATGTGLSLYNDIYAQGLVDETYLRIDEFPGTNTYKTFTQYLDEELVNSEIINEWKPLVYDWRLDLPSVISSGEVIGNDSFADKVSYLTATGTGYLLQELQRLADTSKNGKVTIITHSNGGLVAKYLIKYLEDTQHPLLQKIDTVVLVAVPQLGTPEAIATLLHGTTVVGKGKERDLVEDMKSVYHLIPSEKYYDVVESPVFEFSNGVSSYQMLSDLASTTISSYEAAKDFMTGRGGKWADPAISNIDTPNVLSQSLFTYAESVHSSLDNYLFPDSVRVIQVAGVGINTVRGVAYDDCDIPFCGNSLANLERELIYTKRGDGTVVLPSAIFTNGDTYFIDIRKYNSLGTIFGLSENRNRKHGSILEIEGLQKMFKSLISNEVIITDQYISTAEPLVSSNDTSFQFTLHSPLSLHLYDEEGRHTGLIESQNGIRYYEENIPNSYYREFGEIKYGGVSGDQQVQLKLIGEGSGTFTLEIEKEQADSVVDSVVYEDIPSVKGMIVTLPALTEESNLENLPMSLDVNADGVNDVTIEEGEGLSEYEYVKLLRVKIQQLTLDEKKKQRWEKILQKIEKVIEKQRGCEDRRKKDTCEFRKKIKSKQLWNRFKNSVDFFYKHRLITKDEWNQIQDIIKATKI